jgi:hypothetical protein
MVQVMSISKLETKQLLERLIFEEMLPHDWVQDVWDLNPVLGESAAKLLEAFEILLEGCPPEELENLLKVCFQDKL